MERREKLYFWTRKLHCVTFPEFFDNGHGEGRGDAPAPGEPRANITVTFSLSNFGLFVSLPLCTSAIFSTESGSIAVLIRVVN